MKLFSASLMLFVLSASAWAQANSQERMNAEPPMLGIHWARGANPGQGAGSSPLMSYHNGDIMPTAVTKAIFWGTNWGSASFVGDKITGLDSWYVGMSNSNYAKTSDEYTGLNGTDQVGPLTSYIGHTVDTTPAPKRAPSTSAVLNEVCKIIGKGDVSGEGYYAVYVDTPRHGANYCAWHSYATCGGVNVQFAFFFNLDGDPGCDPQSTVAGESQGLAALANVTGHELSEARSDPRNGGWYDSSGGENADKCAWTFNAPYVTFSDGSKWKIQGNWSNAAYNAGTGYPNNSGQKGCLDGQ